MRRTRSLLVLITLLGLAACGSDDEPTPEASASTAEESTGGEDFCTGMADVYDLVVAAGEHELSGATTPADLVQLVRDTADRMADLEPPDEVADEFEQYAETTDQMAEVLEEVDAADEDAIVAEADEFIQAHSEEQAGIDRVATYVTEECGGEFDDVTGIQSVGP